jgi:transposase
VVDRRDERGVALRHQAHGQAGDAACQEAETTPGDDWEGRSDQGAAAPLAYAELTAALYAKDAVIAELEARVVGLVARIAELEARLRADSSNSSRPPSSDGLRKPARDGRGSRRGAAGPRRKPGGQPGAPGAYLARVAEPDQVVVHAPDRCAGCGADLAAAPVVAVEARQVHDLPPMRLLVTEHRAERRRCPGAGCGQVTAGPFPDHVGAPASYGPGLRAVAAYLHAHQHLPYDRTAQLLDDVFGAPVATGTLAAMMAECAERLDGFLQTVRAQLAGAEVVNFDETGARVAGKLHWVHSASTTALSLFTVHAKRGTEAMDAAGVLPGFTGVAVHDGWSCYGRYMDATHARCNAHHLRELAGVAEQSGQRAWAEGMAALLVEATWAVTRAVAAGLDQLDPERLGHYLRRYDTIIAEGRRANRPPPNPSGKRRRKQSKAANLLDRLDRHRDEVLRFAVDFRVPFTNNQAERDIRMVKLQQKISGCWRTTPGANRFLAIRSYVSTARKQGVEVLHALRRVFAGDPWLPATAGP